MSREGKNKFLLWKEATKSMNDQDNQYTHLTLATEMGGGGDMGMS